MKVKILLGLIVTTIVSVVGTENPITNLTQGILKGKYGVANNGRTISKFTGIPYAKPPVGELRFQEPVDLKSWNGVLDATKFHSVCPQYDAVKKTVIGEEDCLFVNVYTPKIFTSDDPKLKLPVMFYIHSGGWVNGSANDVGPSLLLNKDVVLVTVNYRLGALGFFATGNTHILPNNGLKDQALALRWVKNNIEHFGGDPNNIIAFGHSSGGASAHLHMLSPLSKDLINGVIIQSGSALSNWALMPYFLAVRYSNYLAGEIGCDPFEEIKMMNCLFKANFAHFVTNMNKPGFPIWRQFPFTAFMPVIEFNYKTAFLNEDPLDTIKSGKAADVPIMTGFTTHEGDIKALNYDFDSLKELNENFTDLASLVFHYGQSAAPKYLKEATKLIRNFYFGDHSVDKSSQSKLANLIADSEILSGEDVAVMLHAKFSKKPIYYYVYGYKGSQSFCSSTSENSGVCHGDELFHLFDLMKFPNQQPTDEDKAVTKLLTTLWTNFAAYGNPTPNDQTDILTKWNPVSIDKHSQYFIKNSKEIKMTENMYSERLKFWRNLHLGSRTAKVRDEL